MKNDKLFIWVVGTLAVGTTLYMYWDTLAPYLAFMAAFVALGSLVYGAHRFYRRHRKSIRREWAGVRGAARTKKAVSKESETFEQHVAWLFRKQGFHTAVTEARGELGVDIELERKGKWYAVRTDSTTLREEVAEHAVRRFADSSATNGYEGAYFVTKGRFSPETLSWAARTGRVVLIDGAGLLEMRETTEKHKHSV